MRTLTSKSRKTERSPTDLPTEYRFLKTLGRGGTSEVALIERKSNGCQFAYKYSSYSGKSAEDRSSAINSFGQVARRELELTKHLNHPCVVPVSMISAQEPEAGLIMPLVHGRPLIEAPRPLSPELLREILSSLSMALYYLALKSVAHGDIKPHNLFFAQDVLDGQYDSGQLFFPRLIDFSMGVRAEEALENRLGMGTLGYGAPESLADGSLTHQSDLFSLGVVAYYLACGRHPFLDDTEDPAAISAAVREHAPPRLDKELSGFPLGLAKVIASMLAKEPALRPKNGFVVCCALEEQGASYPFRRAIYPRNLLPKNPKQDIEALSTLPGFNLPARNYLHRISNGDISKVRFILDATFRRGELEWYDGTICAAREFNTYVWPRRLRESERKGFAKLTLSEAKWLVRCAVAGDVMELLQIIEPPHSLRPGVASSSLVETIRGDLTERTIKTQSRLLAAILCARSIEDDDLELLATLQLQAEQIAECAENAFMFCEALKRENRQIEALPLLTKVALFAENTKNSEILIETLHRDGDIRRDSGDMNGAELRYKRIVELSESKKTRLLAETYKDLGDLYKLKQDSKAGLAALIKAEELYKGFGDTTELARVTNNMGNIYWIGSQYDEALHSYRAALKLHRRRDDLTDVSSTVNNIASIYAVTGRIERAIRIYLISLSMKRQLDNRPEIARTLNNLGYTYYLQGNLSEALQVLEEALQINEAESSKKEIITNLDNFVSCAITAGRFADALSHIRRGREISEELHDSHGKAIFDLSLARILLRTGKWDHALRLTQRSGVTAQELSDKVLEVRCLLLQAELHSQMQALDQNALCLEQASELSLEIGDKQAQIHCVLVNGASAKEQLQRALDIALAAKAPKDIALCELALAECYLLTADADKASEFIENAAKFFEHVTEDIDHLRFWRLSAEIRMMNPDIAQDELRDIFFRLRDVDAQARSQGERCQSWKTEIVMAEVGSKCGEYEESYAALMRAMESIRKLSLVLPDRQSVSAFMHQPFMNRMSIEIMQLKRKLSVT